MARVNPLVDVTDDESVDPLMLPRHMKTMTREERVNRGKKIR